jgi:hypothetical protein
MVYIATLVVIQTVWRQMVGSLLNNEFERKRKEAWRPNLSYRLEICLEGLKKTTIKLSPVQVEYKAAHFPQ